MISPQRDEWAAVADTFGADLETARARSGPARLEHVHRLSEDPRGNATLPVVGA